MMGKFKDFAERRTTGVYVSGSYTLETRNKLHEWCSENLTCKLLAPAKYHSTILYSRAHVETSNILTKLTTSHKFKAKGFHLFDSDEIPGCAALVIELNAPELVKLHKELIAAGGTHDHPQYTPHISLSYEADKKMDLSSLKIPDFEFQIESVTTEPLNLNWNK